MIYYVVKMTKNKIKLPTGKELKEIMEKIKCFFGFHKWDNKNGFVEGENRVIRSCINCKKSQTGFEYDVSPSYTETLWEDD